MMNPTTLQCSFQIDNHMFDLCPIIASHLGPLTISLDEETPPTRTRSTYSISLNGPLKRDGTLPAELQCLDGTWICLTVTNERPNRPSEPIRVTNVIPIAVDSNLNPTAKLGAMAKLDAPLQVTLHGGPYTSRNVKQKATFQFVCDHNAEEPTEPEFAWSLNGTHAFTWKSKYACSNVVSGSPASPSEPDPDPPADPPHDPDLIDKVPVHEAKLLPLFLVFIAISSFIFIRVIYPMNRRRARHTKFRPSSSRLLEWAQQAGFTDVDSDAESNELDFDEEIPLTLRMYGSAPSTGVVYGSTTK
ncbi:autophagy-related protein 27-domain-containing protein [Desarmillaria ectypa]|nr:autophagy-related protein 27-domain-containing protein [Desarmillaria ectypa]